MTLDFTELKKQREHSQAFRQTELGKLFYAYQSACINYWRNDANDRISDRRLTELADADRKAELALLVKLMEIAGV